MLETLIIRTMPKDQASQPVTHEEARRMFLRYAQKQGRGPTWMSDEEIMALAVEETRAARKRKEHAPLARRTKGGLRFGQ